MINKKQVTIKIWIDSRKLLRLLAAHTGKSISLLIHELVERELSKYVNKD